MSIDEDSKKKMLYKLNYAEAQILKVLYEDGDYLSTNEIAEKAKLSWNTVDKYACIFYDFGWLFQRRHGRTIYWKINMERKIGDED